MSNLARKFQVQEVPKQRSIKEKVVKRRKITKGETFLFFVFLAVVTIFSIKIIANQAAIYEVNKDIQQLQKEINEQKKSTEDLQAQVNELSEYGRLLEEAKKQGLKINENNVKVVQNQ